MYIISTIISTVNCAFFYVIQEAGDSTNKLCLTSSHASLRKIEDIEDLPNNCKFTYSEKKFRSLDKKYLCRSNKSNVFLRCISKNGLNSNIDVLHAGDSMILQQGTTKMIKGHYDQDTEGHTVESTTTPAGNNDKFKVVMYDAVTLEVKPSITGALPENPSI